MQLRFDRSLQGGEITCLSGLSNIPLLTALVDNLGDGLCGSDNHRKINFVIDVRDATSCRNAKNALAILVDWIDTAPEGVEK